MNRCNHPIPGRRALSLHGEATRRGRSREGGRLRALQKLKVVGDSPSPTGRGRGEGLQILVDLRPSPPAPQPPLSGSPPPDARQPLRTASPYRARASRGCRASASSRGRGFLVRESTLGAKPLPGESGATTVYFLLFTL